MARRREQRHKSWRPSLMDALTCTHHGERAKAKAQRRRKQTERNRGRSGRNPSSLAVHGTVRAKPSQWFVYAPIEGTLASMGHQYHSHGSNLPMKMGLGRGVGQQPLPRYQSRFPVPGAPRLESAGTSHSEGGGGGGGRGRLALRWPGPPEAGETPRAPLPSAVAVPHAATHGQE